MVLLDPLLEVLGVVLDDPVFDEPDRDELLGDLTSEEEEPDGPEDDLGKRGETMGEEDEEDKGEVEVPLEEEEGGRGAAEVGLWAWNSEVGLE